MRGLEEIEKINENPEEHYKQSADYSGGSDFDVRNPEHVKALQKASRERAQKFHGERVEARQREKSR